MLIAEDQEHVREALAMLLRGRGYSVLLCASPREAMLAAGQQHFDLALVDMNYRRDSTSGVEGLNLIESLRQLDNTLPIAALTAWGNVDLAVNAMKSGASDFIEKPWRNDALLEKVESLARRGREVRSQHRISEYEKQDAQQVQMRIVPRRHVAIKEIELFGESIPVGTVGGDYFGVWQPSPESLHFCVADVSGKGTSGALIAAMLHASVSTLAVADGGAAKIVGEVEAILREQLGNEHFVTMFYGVLDVGTCTLEYVNAGHCPPILRHVNGDVELLESTRPVLGLLSQRAGGAERIRLHAGDSLALFTDGITEAADESGEEFGAERLRLMLEGDKELQERHAQILQTVRGHAKGKLADDATLVLVSVRREAANGKASEAEAACCPHEY
ncbi:MAG TPA: SpoIIE family protein phosphatase [Candidatus Eisenbacteria bacterium]|nr:SpoIIE family protein phosphatase [Candidatus Eisenbacteria bacterium]